MSRINESKSYKVGKFSFNRSTGDDWVGKNEAGEVIATFVKGAAARAFCNTANKFLAAGESIDDLILMAAENYEQGVKQREQKAAKAAARATEALKKEASAQDDAAEVNETVEAIQA